MVTAGIITLHFSVNYGAVLQCLALTEALRESGIQVKVINYYPEYAKYYWEPKKKYSDAIKDAIAASNKTNRTKTNVFVRCLKSLKYAYVMNRSQNDYEEKYHAFTKFREDYLPLTDEISRLEDLQKISFDLLVTGSDQVWNSNYTNYSFDKAYFLEWGKKDAFRIAYAVSTHMYDDNEHWDKLLELTKNIDRISVREKRVCKKINEIGCFQKAVTVLDPTLLLKASEWEKYESLWKTEREYILVYSLHENGVCRQYAEKMKSEYNNVDVIDISPNRVSSEFVWRGNCHPGDFLSLIHQAKMIVTDSFHGTAFSIIYNRQFVSISCNKSDTRILDLLNSIGLGERCKSMYDDEIFTDIVYVEPNKKLEKLRSNSLEFLREGIQQEKIRKDNENC